MYNIPKKMEVSLLKGLLLVSLCMSRACAIRQHEPSCTSKYDYDHKLLHAIVTLEVEHELIKKQIVKLEDDAETDRTKHKDETSRLQQLIDNKDAEIQTLARRVQELEKNASTYMIEDGPNAAGYTYKDYMAQASCAVLTTRHVYAVRRTCSNVSPSCDVICKALGHSCVDALHVYDRPVMTSSDVAKQGLRTYRYSSCGGNFCGPNFCCCNGT